MEPQDTFSIPPLDLSLDTIPSSPPDTVIFTVSDEENEENIEVDKNLLAASGPYFKALLMGGFKESATKNLKIHHVHPDNFKRILLALRGTPIVFKDEEDVSQIFLLLHWFHIMEDKVNIYLRDILPSYVSWDTYFILIDFYHDGEIPGDYIDSIAKTIHGYADLSMLPPETIMAIILSRSYREGLRITGAIVNNLNPKTHFNVTLLMEDLRSYMTQPNAKCCQFIAIGASLANLLGLEHMPNYDSSKLYTRKLLTKWFHRYIEKNHLDVPLPDEYLEDLGDDLDSQEKLTSEVRDMRQEFSALLFGEEDGIMVNLFRGLWPLGKRQYLVRIDLLLREFFFPNVTGEIAPLYIGIIDDIILASDHDLIQNIEDDVITDDDVFAFAREHERFRGEKRLEQESEEVGLSKDEFLDLVRERTRFVF